MNHRNQIQESQTVRCSIIGMGKMGKGLLYQCLATPGVECVAIADCDVSKAIECAEVMKLQYKVVDTLSEANAAIEKGYLAVCEDGELLARNDHSNVLIESTSSIIPGARFSVAALETGKHLVMMNSEVDLIHGPYLMRLAEQNGLTYTSCDGDQHGVIKRLIDEMELWGFEVVMGGNIKGFLDRYSNPIKIKPEADKRGLDYIMCTSYTDGTKLNIEMSLLANALGMATDVPGMHGPRANHVKDAMHLFDLPALRQRGKPVVDYILGAQPDGGVYAIGYCDNPFQQDMLRYYKMGEGPFYLFYRPYHLCHVESMKSVVEAARNGTSLLKPDFGMCTNVFAYAKKDLRAGDRLDGLGGHATYGLIENCTPEAVPSGIPACLAHDVVLKRDLKKDQKIRLADVEFEPHRLDFELYFKCFDESAAALHRERIA